MNAKEITHAMGCEHNRLWTCEFPHSSGKKCTGPCVNCTTTQLKIGDYICPICESPASEGYCVNKLCVNNG